MTDERRLAVGSSLDFGAAGDATPGPDADEATTIEIGGEEVWVRHRLWASPDLTDGTKKAHFRRAVTDSRPRGVARV
ncbi:hypothetical protein BRD05_06710 [Halobacteriales archaeon QS_9_70_65]|nr:MAG: hypothetical protein BRD05_06710 [Halobacteriales archaeon QS_9_70_65]